MKLKVITVLLVFFILHITLPPVYSISRLCYACRNVPHPRDCTRTTECSADEVCYVDKFVTSAASVYYNSGCKLKTLCHYTEPDYVHQTNINNSASNSIIGRRFDPGAYPICSTCCTTNYCNTRQCDSDSGSGILPNKCLKCDYVDNPLHCHTVTGCPDLQTCRTSLFVNAFGEKRYRLGCLDFQTCFSGELANQSSTTAGDLICDQCCMGENCNRNLCKETYETTSSTPAPTTASSADHPTVCADASGDHCTPSLLPVICSDSFFKKFCNKSCGLCSHHDTGQQSVVTSATKQLITTLPLITSTPLITTTHLITSTKTPSLTTTPKMDVGSTMILTGVSSSPHATDGNYCSQTDIEVCRNATILPGICKSAIFSKLMCPISCGLCSRLTETTHPHFCQNQDEAICLDSLAEICAVADYAYTLCPHSCGLCEQPASVG